MPVPVGSPHCSTANSGAAVSRWHGVPSKYPCWARLTKLLTVHGALPLSSRRPIVPSLVVMAARTTAGTVGTAPVRGGVAGLSAGVAVAG